MFEFFKLRRQYCCDICESLLNSAGKSGFSIVPTDWKNKKIFFLQFRTVDFDLSKQVSNTVGEHAIQFCPWCSAKLRSGINREVLDNLIRKNKHLLSDPFDR